MDGGLRALGWDDGFWTSQGPLGDDGAVPARVVAVDRDRLLLTSGDAPFSASLSGRFLFEHHEPAQWPCVGDWVQVVRGADGGAGLVQAVLERRTALRRRGVGGASRAQMIAANVDTVIIVMSCHFDFNVNRLERYLVMVRDGGAQPWVLLTKTDLVTPQTLAGQLEQIRAAGIEAPVMTMSALTQGDAEALRAHLLPAKTYCFVGSSGVGKSTLINQLLGQDVQLTASVSHTGEGRHTTVRRELVRLPNGALVIDNPGMREFGMIDADVNAGGSFADITSLAADCHFVDCTHTGEPGCAVRAAVDRGDIDPGHFGNYLKLREENAFYELSALQRRKKDRAFGKFVQSAKKGLSRSYDDD